MQPPQSNIAQSTTEIPLSDALRALGLQVPPPHVLSQIEKDIGSEFAIAISKAGNDPDAKEYLNAVFTSYSPAVLGALKEIGITSCTPEMLVPVLSVEGRKLRAALQDAARGKASEEQRSYIAATLATFESTYQTASTEASEDTPGSTGANTPSTRLSTDKVRIETTHFYTKKTAISFTKDITQSGGRPTVCIDGASSTTGEGGPYDWSRKLAFQLTVSELPLVYGVFAGYLKGVRLVGHGRSNDKSFSIEDQGRHYFLSLQQKEKQTHAVPAEPMDTFLVMAMLLDQIKANTPTLEPAERVMIIKRVCEKHASAMADRANKR